MQKASVRLDKEYTVGRIDDRIYGSFVEHLGRAIYEGVYQPGHPSADDEGFRGDVLDLVRELKVPIVRYPGGNFVSGYRWEDGVGPVENRPVRMDLAWAALEPNTIGVNEFASWAQKANTEVMMAVNLGTRGPQEAADLVEYCNVAGKTHLSDLRIAHGAKQPHGFKLWCLGNEMDGHWQTCTKTAAEYGRIANEAAKMMKWTDPSIELVACGSSSHIMHTFGAWEAEVLEHTYENVDYISIHQYLKKTEGMDSAEFLATSVSTEHFIRDVVAACDYVKSKKKSAKTIHLSFDEWNVWYSKEQERDGVSGDYTMEDALVCGGMLLAMLRNGDRVKVACQAQLINALGAIATCATGDAWRQTVYYPYRDASLYGRGDILRAVVSSPVYACKAYDEVPCVEVAAIATEKGVSLFALNRSGQPIELSCDARGFATAQKPVHTGLWGFALEETNTFERPDAVTPKTGDACIEDGKVKVVLPPYSWNTILI